MCFLSGLFSTDKLGQFIMLIIPTFHYHDIKQNLYTKHTSATGTLKTYPHKGDCFCPTGRIFTKNIDVKEGILDPRSFYYFED